MLHEGQQYAPPLAYAPLPDRVVSAEEAQVKTVAIPGS